MGRRKDDSSVELLALLAPATMPPVDKQAQRSAGTEAAGLQWAARRKAATYQWGGGGTGSWRLKPAIRRYFFLPSGGSGSTGEFCRRPLPKGNGLMRPVLRQTSYKG